MGGGKGKGGGDTDSKDSSIVQNALIPKPTHVPIKLLDTNMRYLKKGVEQFGSIVRYLGLGFDETDENGRTGFNVNMDRFLNAFKKEMSFLKNLGFSKMSGKDAKEAMILIEELKGLVAKRKDLDAEITAIRHDLADMNIQETRCNRQMNEMRKSRQEKTNEIAFFERAEKLRRVAIDADNRKFNTLARENAELRKKVLFLLRLRSQSTTLAYLEKKVEEIKGLLKHMVNEIERSEREGLNLREQLYKIRRDRDINEKNLVRECKELEKNLHVSTLRLQFNKIRGQERFRLDLEKNRSEATKDLKHAKIELTYLYEKIFSRIENTFDSMDLREVCDTIKTLTVDTISLKKFANYMYGDAETQREENISTRRKTVELIKNRKKDVEQSQRRVKELFEKLYALQNEAHERIERVQALVKTMTKLLADLQYIATAVGVTPESFIHLLGDISNINTFTFQLFATTIRAKILEILKKVFCLEKKYLPSELPLGCHLLAIEEEEQLSATALYEAAEAADEAGTEDDMGKDVGCPKIKVPFEMTKCNLCLSTADSLVSKMIVLKILDASEAEVYKQSLLYNLNKDKHNHTLVKCDYASQFAFYLTKNPLLVNLTKVKPPEK